jgi:hypothetical protein
VPVELMNALDVAAPVEGLLELLADPSVRDAVLCGHGEQIGRFLRLLAERAGTDGRLPRQKGATWVLDISAGDLRAAHYLPPLQRKCPPAGPGRASSAGAVELVAGVPWAAGQPGSGFAEHELVAKVAATPGVLPLERLQPAAAEAVGQCHHQPLLGRGEPGDQLSQSAELSLIDNRRPVHA